MERRRRAATTPVIVTAVAVAAVAAVAAAVTAAVTIAMSATASAAAPPPAATVVDCSTSTEPFTDLAIPEPQTVQLSVGDLGGGTTLRFSARTLHDGPATLSLASDVADPVDVAIARNGVPVATASALQPGTSCQGELSLAPGHYTAVTGDGAADVEWWVTVDLAELHESSTVAVAPNLLGGEAAFTDACDVFSPDVVMASFPAGLMDVPTSADPIADAPGPDDWQSDCAWGVILGDGSGDPGTAGVALFFSPPGDQAVTDFHNAASADAEAGDPVRVSSECYLLDHAVSCLVDQVAFVVAVDGGELPADSPAGADLDSVAVTLARDLVSRLS